MTGVPMIMLFIKDSTGPTVCHTALLFFQAIQVATAGVQKERTHMETAFVGAIPVGTWAASMTAFVLNGRTFWIITDMT